MVYGTAEPYYSYKDRGVSRTIVIKRRGSIDYSKTIVIGMVAGNGGR